MRRGSEDGEGEVDSGGALEAKSGGLNGFVGGRRGTGGGMRSGWNELHDMRLQRVRVLGEEGDKPSFRGVDLMCPWTSSEVI